MADLGDASQIKASLADSTYVVHTATPMEEAQVAQMVEVAVAGTLNVLNACHDYQVKKCVVTGSTDAVIYTAKEDEAPEGTPWNENSWSNPNRPGGLWPYSLSKTSAELKALEY